jgi:hypothetical protein
MGLIFIAGKGASLIFFLFFILSLSCLCSFLNAVYLRYLMLSCYIYDLCLSNFSMFLRRVKRAKLDGSQVFHI